RRLSQPARITRKKAAILRFIYCRLPTWSRPNRGCVRDHPVFKKLAAVEEYGDQPRRRIGSGSSLAPLTELPQVETGCDATVHVLAHGMHVRSHVHRLAAVRIGEMRLHADQLPIGVQLAQKKLTARAKHARGFEENGCQVVHVLEDQI